MDAVRAVTPAFHIPRVRDAVASAVALAALAVLAWLALAPPVVPAPVASVASPAWAGRANDHQRVLAASTRSIGGSDNAHARAYLMLQLRAMGLAPAVQRATVRTSVTRLFGGIHHTIGVVHNVVATIPGSAPDAAQRPALLLATHYDSGAAPRDALPGAATASALLDTARALHAAPPANDIVLLFADGERVGMLGSRGFVEQHPLAGRIGMALRFDGAVDGPLRMLEASGAGAPALAGWMQAAPELRGTSANATLAWLLGDAPHIGPLTRLDAPVLLFGGGEPRSRHRAAPVGRRHAAPGPRLRCGAIGTGPPGSARLLCTADHRARPPCGVAGVGAGDPVLPDAGARMARTVRPGRRAGRSAGRVRRVLPAARGTRGHLELGRRAGRRRPGR